MTTIRTIRENEFEQVRSFPPRDWNMDLPGFITLHWDSPYFHPIVAECDSTIIGFANSIRNETVGWLGNIIVLPEYRNRGVGNVITTRLVEYLREEGCTTQILISTEMGKPVYAKIGFEECSTYEFFKNEDGNCLSASSDKIEKMTPEDHAPVRELDREATGEDRTLLLSKFLPNGWVYREHENNVLSGYYLPDFGSGLVVARNPEAGIALTRFRSQEGKTTFVVPSENTSAIDYLLACGFNRRLVVPRMVLGHDVPWKPRYIFNRAAGYCG